MIRFGRDVYIRYFRYELVPILLNASMWSNMTGIDLLVTLIDNSQKCASADHRAGLAVQMDVEPSLPELRDKLRAYLEHNMPSGFHVLLEPTHIEVHVALNGAKSK